VPQIPLHDWALAPEACVLKTSTKDRIKMTLDIANAPSKEEILEAIEDAERCVTLWRKRALYAAVAFSFSCALVYPFLAGQALHAHWEQPDLRLQVTPGMNGDRGALCWIRLRFVEVGRLRIGAL
jgi:hypothetical protein